MFSFESFVKIRKWKGSQEKSESYSFFAAQWSQYELPSLSSIFMQRSQTASSHPMHVIPWSSHAMFPQKIQPSYRPLPLSEYGWTQPGTQQRHSFFPSPSLQLRSECAWLYVEDQCETREGVVATSRFENITFWSLRAFVNSWIRVSTNRFLLSFNDNVSVIKSATAKTIRKQNKIVWEDLPSGVSDLTSVAATETALISEKRRGSDDPDEGTSAEGGCVSVWVPMSRFSDDELRFTDFEHDRLNWSVDSSVWGDEWRFFRFGLVMVTADIPCIQNGQDKNEWRIRKM
jgi:hypothetical protein